MFASDDHVKVLVDQTGQRRGKGQKRLEAAEQVKKGEVCMTLKP